ncbi:hypothetical protein TWF718_000057 [Orbilia javanica]|uniref:Uncharacterized protein n=1 Tax=Orbilia javanica TaxID=47235 RepID=A0AAN8RG62_9PEZI
MAIPIFLPSNNSQSQRRTGSRSQQQEPDSPTLELGGGTSQSNNSRVSYTNSNINWQEVRDVVRSRENQPRQAGIYGASGFSGSLHQATLPS